MMLVKSVLCTAVSAVFCLFLAVGAVSTAMFAFACAAELIWRGK